jgi:hypothetical protein
VKSGGGLDDRNHRLIIIVINDVIVVRNGQIGLNKRTQKVRKRIRSAIDL